MTVERNQSSISPQTTYNQAFLNRAKEQGRKSIRGMLTDKETSEMYSDMTATIPKKKIGVFLSALVHLAKEAEDSGKLSIDEQGNVLLNGEVFYRED